MHLSLLNSQSLVVLALVYKAWPPLWIQTFCLHVSSLQWTERCSINIPVVILILHSEHMKEHRHPQLRRCQSEWEGFLLPVFHLCVSAETWGNNQDMRGRGAGQELRWKGRMRFHRSQNRTTSESLVSLWCASQPSGQTGWKLSSSQKSPSAAPTGRGIPKNAGQVNNSC